MIPDKQQPYKILRKRKKSSNKPIVPFLLICLVVGCGILGVKYIIYKKVDSSVVNSESSQESDQTPYTAESSIQETSLESHFTADFPQLQGLSMYDAITQLNALEIPYRVSFQGTSSENVNRIISQSFDKDSSTDATLLLTIGTNMQSTGFNSLGLTSSYCVFSAKEYSIQKLSASIPKNNIWIGSFWNGDAWAWLDGTDFSYSNWDFYIGEDDEEYIKSDNYFGNEYYIRYANSNLRFDSWKANKGKWDDTANKADGYDGDVPISSFDFICEWNT